MDIEPLFTSTDLVCMEHRGVKLKAFAYMSDAAGDETYGDHSNARHVLARLKAKEVPRMPLHAAPWPDAKIALFEGWIESGFSA